MDKKGVKWLLIVVLIFSVVVVGRYHCTVASAAESRSQTQVFEDVTPKQAYSLIQENKESPNFVILDVRTPKEFKQGHIEGAINLDYYAKTFVDDLDRLDKSQTYLILCRTGRRSGKTFGFMKKFGFQEVYHMVGGIRRWKAEGLPTTR